MSEGAVSSGQAIPFGTMPWEPLSEHARQKRIVVQNRIVRLIQLDEGFREADWCHKAHVGYVVEGEMQLTLVDRSENLQAGDALILAGGEDGKHKAEVVHGPVTLFLVEPA